MVGDEFGDAKRRGCDDARLAVAQVDTPGLGEQAVAAGHCDTAEVPRPHRDQRGIVVVAQFVEQPRTRVFAFLALNARTGRARTGAITKQKVVAAAIGIDDMQFTVRHRQLEPTDCFADGVHDALRTDPPQLDDLRILTRAYVDRLVVGEVDQRKRSLAVDPRHCGNVLAVRRNLHIAEPHVPGKIRQRHRFDGLHAGACQDQSGQNHPIPAHCNSPVIGKSLIYIVFAPW